jgi:hypothetical protein
LNGSYSSLLRSFNFIDLVELLGLSNSRLYVLNIDFVGFNFYFAVSLTISISMLYSLDLTL